MKEGGNGIVNTVQQLYDDDEHFAFFVNVFSFLLTRIDLHSLLPAMPFCVRYCFFIFPGHQAFWLIVVFSLYSRGTLGVSGLSPTIEPSRHLYEEHV